jgi:hypothetical protein
VGIVEVVSHRERLVVVWSAKRNNPKEPDRRHDSAAVLEHLHESNIGGQPEILSKYPGESCQSSRHLDNDNDNDDGDDDKLLRRRRCGR